MVSILTASDNVVDCYLDQGRMFAGGNALNVSVFARRAGARTAFAGTVGTDAAGALIRNALVNEDVSTEFLQVRHGSTGYCVIGRNDGDRVFLHADAGVSKAALDGGLVSRASGFDAVHLTASSDLNALAGNLAEESRLSYDFSTNRDASLLEEVAPHCFLATFSGGDLPPGEGHALAHRAVRLGAAWALVTFGRQGALLLGRQEKHEIQAVETAVVDTLGAGDTFIATLLVGLVDARNPADAMVTAAEAAALTCSRLGAFGEGSQLHTLSPKFRHEPIDNKAR